VGRRAGVLARATAGYEGPECYQLKPVTDGKPAVWCLVLDRYSKNAGYHPFVTEDLAAGQFTPAPDFRFLFLFRHGSILPLSPEEFTRLESAFGKPGSLKTP